jgi:hypothetical protein
MARHEDHYQSALSWSGTTKMLQDTPITFAKKNRKTSFLGLEYLNSSCFDKLEDCKYFRTQSRRGVSVTHEV